MEAKNKAPICLVLGINGQDGSYLAEQLIADGCEVIGLGRQEASKWISDSCDHFTYYQYDLNRANDFLNVLQKFSPDYIYHAAAVHGSSGFNYEAVWYSAHAVNSLITHAALEYCRINMACHFIYLSSSKVLNFSDGDLITESTAKKSDSIYSITKNTSSNLIEYYRSCHGVNASVVYTFNHESVRRSGDFFIPKIVNILKKSIGNPDYCEAISNLSFFCDWGCAKEYMSLVVDISRQAIGVDFVMGTGATLWGKDFAKDLFGRYGLLADRHIYEVNPNISQVGNKLPWHVSCENLSKYIHRTPSRRVYEVCDEILNSK